MKPRIVGRVEIPMIAISVPPTCLEAMRQLLEEDNLQYCVEEGPRYHTPAGEPVNDDGYFFVMADEKGNEVSRRLQQRIEGLFGNSTPTEGSP